MRYLMIPLFAILSFEAFGQSKENRYQISRWEASVSSGIFFDLFYADILGDPSTPPVYPPEEGRKIYPGKMDRIEVKYLLCARVSVMNQKWF